MDIPLFNGLSFTNKLVDKGVHFVIRPLKKLFAKHIHLLVEVPRLRSMLLLAARQLLTLRS